MKKIFLLGAFALLSTTLFSCTADEYDDVKKEINPAKPSYADDGPGDGTIKPPPPPPGPADE
ncbi:hypothetical protein EYY60_13590 [Flavobacterium zhairuonense]|uniref:hypothetical protein n=1 Tax=Flavobacterium zhairuonense TaxID=2493631 RepID=UPI00104794DC|nr:hypothetical protein [Flavobacterium zhairuonense]KAF2509406.1 hypothetical protein EYY60_13590 [Flavobacterium zhairuonense]